VERLKGDISDEYTLILLADHGGHDRTHGTEMPEDMTIPMVFSGRRFAKGREISDLSIKDVAATVASLLEVPVAPEWEGVAVKPLAE
jgi:arylsulfatase A-like enzyme